jgi:hypothetical protein
MQRHSQLSEEELVGIQDNHNSNAEFWNYLSGFENESELEYTDKEYLSEDDLELDSEEMNRLTLSTAIPYGMETLVEQEKSNAFTMFRVLSIAADVIRMILRFKVNAVQEL